MFIGHKKVINILDKSLTSNKVSHAYLFSGPESVGKFTLAKIFALAVISGIKKINSELLEDYSRNLIHFPDLIIIEPPTEEKKGIIKEKEIKAEILRDVLGKMFLYPYSGEMRVLIINNAHKMNRTAQNVLLKTLEEPNDTSIIILVTHQEGSMLSTIRSRCQKINYSLVQDEEILKTIGIIREADREKNNYFMGRPGIAFRTEDESRNYEEEIISRLIAVSKLNVTEKLNLAVKISENLIIAKKIFERYIWMQRSESLRKNNKVALVKYFDNIQFVVECLDELGSTNANARLTVEKALLKLN
jgi:DNA polymerase III subunit delta'